MNHVPELERVGTVVVGAGQAGLSTGCHLARRGLPFVILDAHERIVTPGGSGWDSLRLFSPARSSGLPGMPFPGPPHAYPTKHGMADHLEALPPPAGQGHVADPELVASRLGGFFTG